MREIKEKNRSKELNELVYSNVPGPGKCYWVGISDIEAENKYVDKYKQIQTNKYEQIQTGWESPTLRQRISMLKQPCLIWFCICCCRLIYFSGMFMPPTTRNWLTRTSGQATQSGIKDIESSAQSWPELFPSKLQYFSRIYFKYFKYFSRKWSKWNDLYETFRVGWGHCSW